MHKKIKFVDPLFVGELNDAGAFDSPDFVKRVLGSASNSQLNKINRGVHSILGVDLGKAVTYIKKTPYHGGIKTSHVITIIVIVLAVAAFIMRGRTKRINNGVIGVKR